MLSHVRSSIINSSGCICGPHSSIILSRVPCYHRTISLNTGSSSLFQQIHCCITPNCHNCWIISLWVILISDDEKQRWKNGNRCHTGLAFVLHDDKEPTVFSLAGPGVLRPWQTHDNLALKTWTISPKYHSIQHYKPEPLKPFTETYSPHMTAWMVVILCWSCVQTAV